VVTDYCGSELFPRALHPRRSLYFLPLNGFQTFALSLRQGRLRM
jgi:hypothetical protein